MVMVCWGVSDLIQSVMIRQLGTATTMLVRNVFTLLVAGALGGYLVAAQKLGFDAQAVGIIVCSSVAYVLGYYAYMKACEIGRLTLASPVASTYSLVTIALSIVFLGEWLTAGAWMAVLAIFIGIAMISGNPLQALQGGGRDFGLALRAMTGFGIAFFILGFSAKKLDVTSAFFYSALSQATLFIALALSRDGRARRADITAMRLYAFLGHSILVNGGWVCYIFASNVAELSLVTPISSVYSGVTVLLASWLFKERTSRAQKIGIGVLLCGVFFLGRG